MPITTLNPNLLGTDSAGASKLSSAGGLVQLHATGLLAVANNTANNFAVANSGFVGIGTVSPTQKLQVESSANLSIQLTKTGVASFVITNNGTDGTELAVESTPMIFKSASTERMRIDSGGNLLATGGFVPTNTSRLVVRGFSPGTYNNLFSQNNATVQIISNEMNNDTWNPTLNITTVRQSLTTGANSFGGIGFSTIDDSNDNGMNDAGRIAIVNESPSAVSSGAAMAFYTQVGSATRTNAAVERMRINSTGAVTTPSQPSFYAYPNAEIVASAGKVLIFNTTRWNIGGHYNTSNGRFTAPVAGYYLFELQSLAQGADTQIDVSLRVNGASYSNFRTWSGDAQVGGGTIVSLGVSDYVEFYRSYESRNTYPGPDWSFFCGRLLG